MFQVLNCQIYFKKHFFFQNILFIAEIGQNKLFGGNSVLNQVCCTKGLQDKISQLRHLDSPQEARQNVKAEKDLVLLKKKVDKLKLDC